MLSFWEVRRRYRYVVFADNNVLRVLSYEYTRINICTGASLDVIQCHDRLHKPYYHYAADTHLEPLEVFEAQTSDGFVA